MAITARISKSGQVTIPAEVRKGLGLKPGDTVLWRLEEGGTARVSSIKFTLDEMDGILGPIPENMTLDELVREATAEGIERRHRHGREEAG